MYSHHSPPTAPAEELAMPNIVYVLTNPAMPGLVKIGMTDRDDVQRRMGDLYTTGVPLPFECVIAREIEDRQALEIENALHTAFGPNRVNTSREFFEIDPEQAQALLRVMPGRDVTPPGAERQGDPQDEDQVASREYKKRQARTNEFEFLESVNERGNAIYRRVLALGNQEGMLITWATRSFTLNVVSGSGRIPVCNGYNQLMYTMFGEIAYKSSVPDEVVDALRQEALNTGLFRPADRGNNLSCRTDLSLDESQLDDLTGWLSLVIDKIREYEGVSRTDSVPPG